MRRTALLVAVLVLGLAGAAAAQGPAKVRLAFTPRLAQAPLYIAQDKGFFREEGLEVELVSFRGASTEMLPLLVRGDLDGGILGPSAALFNAMSEGIAFRIVADAGRIEPGFDGYPYVLVVRKDLSDAGRFKTLADLKGKAIGFGARGTTLAYMMYRTLDLAGLKESDVTIKFLTNPADMAAALTNKAIDANAIVVPTHLPLVENGTVVVWKDGRELAPGLQAFTLVYAENFMKTRPDAAHRLLRAYLKAVRWYYGELAGKREELTAISAKWTKMDPAVIAKAPWTYFSPNGHVNLDDLDAQQELWSRLRLVKTKVDLGRVVDSALLDRALKELGTAPEPKRAR